MIWRVARTYLLANLSVTTLACPYGRASGGFFAARASLLRASDREICTTGRMVTSTYDRTNYKYTVYGHTENLRNRLVWLLVKYPTYPIPRAPEQNGKNIATK